MVSTLYIQNDHNSVEQSYRFNIFHVYCTGLRLLRELRWKAEESTYGSHLAVSMGIGLLFLAGGRASLRRDPTSVGALLLATAPRYPSRTLDHQYHMQAQRHLYVLAIEWRLLRVIDADSGKMISLSIDVVMESGDVTTLTAPCLLTELSSIVEIRLSSVSKNTFIGTTILFLEILECLTLLSIIKYLRL